MNLSVFVKAKILIAFLQAVLVSVSVIDVKGQYSSPESVTYDSLSAKYFISNTASRIILQRDRQGNVSEFVNVGSSIHGVTVHAGKLFVCNGTRVRGYDISSAAETFNVQISGSTFLNDLAIDASGMMYVSDFSARRIYKVNTSTQEYWTYVPSTGNTPNGVYVDAARNRLLICCWGSSAPIRSVSFADSSITTLVTTPYSNLDGISLDRNDNVYVSSWGIQSVVKYDINFALSPVVVTGGLSNPADIFVNKAADTLAIPNAGNNTVTFLNIGTASSIQSTGGLLPDGISLQQNYPNPFNPSTTIRFSIERNGTTALRIFDVSGKMTSEKLFGMLAKGEYKYEFNASSLPSGLYFYELQSGDVSVRRKMTLVK
ncbi:MAG: T9SS type A sorting domain-containing protein [Ignavibacteria bacterium]|nr:T9SS type A sorting domain-containing protein [Ignavibacteria bacterium]